MVPNFSYAFSIFLGWSVRTFSQFPDQECQQTTDSFKVNICHTTDQRAGTAVVRKIRTTAQLQVSSELSEAPWAKLRVIEWQQANTNMAANSCNVISVLPELWPWFHADKPSAWSSLLFSEFRPRTTLSAPLCSLFPTGFSLTDVHHHLKDSSSRRLWMISGGILSFTATQWCEEGSPGNALYKNRPGTSFKGCTNFSV